MFHVTYVVNADCPDTSDLPAWFKSDDGQQAHPATEIAPTISDALVLAAAAIKKYDYDILPDGSASGSIHLIIQWVVEDEDIADLYFTYYTEIGAEYT
jgi:hypothetical protein